MRKLTPVPQPEKMTDFKKREPAVEPPQKKLARILVVDDDSLIRNLMGEMLDGYSVGTANDGVEGLTLFKAGDFDLVVTDLKMPKMSGMELLAEIKLINPDAKVIVISGRLDVETVDMLKQMGAAAVLEKPMGILEIEEHVEKILLN